MGNRDYARESELDDVLHRLTNAVYQGGMYCHECGDDEDGLPHSDQCVRFVLGLVNEVVGLAPVPPVHMPAAIFYTGEWGDGPSLGSDWANEETLHEIIESLKPLDETWATLSISDAPLFNLVEEYPADGTGLYREEGVRHPPFYDTLIEADPHYPGYFRAIRSKD